MSASEYIVKPDGVFFREIIETPIKVTEQTFNPISYGQKMRFSRMVSVHEPKSYMEAAFKPGHGVAYSYLGGVEIHCPWRLVDGDPPYLTPNFSSADPEMKLFWAAPPGTNILLAIHMANQGSQGWILSKSYLLLIDANRKTYALPLGNLFDDGGICLGKFEANAGFSGMVDAVWRQFHCSKWNADLWPSVKMERCAGLVRLHPETHDTLPPLGKWTGYCPLVSTPVQEFLP